MNLGSNMRAIALGVLATALAIAGSASAETIYLSCDRGGGAVERHTVDLTNNTVDNHPASINPTAIDWSCALTSDSPGLTGTMYEHIDRTTGKLTNRVDYFYRGRPNGSGPGSGTCSVVPAPAVKF